MITVGGNYFGNFKDDFNRCFHTDLFGVTVIILLQEESPQDSGAIAGAADTYWGRNKGRSMEGRLVTGTKILVALFIIIAAVLNLGIF